MPFMIPEGILPYLKEPASNPVDMYSPSMSFRFFKYLISSPRGICFWLLNVEEVMYVKYFIF